MPDSTFAVPGFLGGEISRAAQGRFDKPDYRVSMKTCLNGLPNEIGTWVRRPGTQYAGHTRGGLAAKVGKFDFESDSAVTLEFTDGYLRFRAGTVLIDTNDSVGVTAVSTADPAVVTLDTAVDWATGDTAMLDGVAAMLDNRQFLLTKNNTTHFSLVDAVTNNTIDGSTLGTITAGTIRRVHELTTAYVGGAWSGIRAAQAETTDILLCPTVAPQALTVESEPTADDYAQFAISPAVFLDGPYLDPFTNGVQATPSAKTGIISLTLSFPAYDSTKAYKTGDFVVYSSVIYRALQSQNVNHQPDVSATYWEVSSAAAAINDGQGFLGTDIGRQVRLFSEPAAWAVGSTYASGAVVSYNPTGLPGATQYWSSKAGSNTGHIPGTDLIWWELIASNAAIWSWGRITSLSNTINPALAGSVNMGDMTLGGGLAAAFNGSFSQAYAASARAQTSASGVFINSLSFSSYVGKDYSGASDQVIDSASVYPSSDIGFVNSAFSLGGVTASQSVTITFNLRGKASAPSSASDGTLLGTSGPVPNQFSAVSIKSSSSAAWKYVWVEQIATYTIPGFASSYVAVNAIAQLSLFNPPGSGTGAGVSVEILGPPLLYTAAIQTWRLGVYSNTTGWPTCGKYYEGRLWLGGAVKNRLDASVSNGINGGILDFAPTGPTGAVAASNAISYTLNDDSVNQIIDFRADTPGLIACTKAAEFLILAPTTGPIAPTNIAARKVTKFGSENIPAVDTEHTRVFVKRYGRKLVDYFADANFNKPAGQNLADKAEHIVSSGIAELAYVTAVTPIIWGRDNDGALFGVTYKRDTLTTTTGPTYAAFHRHALGTGRIVESMCAGPSVGGDLDSLTMVTNDETTGIRHVEVLTDTPDENTALGDNWLLDGAVTPASTSTTSAASAGAPYGGLTINGLWHLNGQTVQVFAGGLDCGDRGDNATTYTDFTVENGSITVPYGDGAVAGPGRGRFTAAFAAGDIQIVVGMTYTSDGQVVRPMTQADSGARNGPAFAKLSRGHRYGVSLIGVPPGAIKFGGDLTKTMFPALFRDARNTVQTDPLVTFTGIHQDALQDDYDYENGALAWRITRPLPATIAAIGTNLATQDQ